VGRFNINTAGFFIVGLFIVTWLAAWAYWRLARVEERASLGTVDEATP
jgi:high-affinity nickel-transport protein